MSASGPSGPLVFTQNLNQLFRKIISVILSKSQTVKIRPHKNAGSSADDKTRADKEFLNMLVNHLKINQRKKFN